MLWKKYSSILFISFIILSPNVFAASQKKISQIQLSLAKEQQAINDIEQIREKQNKEIQQLQHKLANQLRSAAILSHGKNNSRLMEYHSYIGRARIDLIKKIKQAQRERSKLIKKRQKHKEALKILLLQAMQQKPPSPSAFIRAPKGTAVKAIAPGKVIFADWLRGFGLMVIISHNKGYMSLYGKNYTLYAKMGDKVSMGQTIALAGNRHATGFDARYFEVRHNGTPLPPGQNKFIMSR